MVTKGEKEKYMKLAFEQAQLAEDQDEVPIGAVVVSENGTVLGTGYNRRELDQDGTQHAEIISIRQACQKIESWRLNDCSIFITLEPCPMCAGAIINSRIKNVFYGAFDPKAGAAGSVINLFEVENLNHHPNVYGGLFKDQAAQLLKNFFKKIRQQQKQLKLKDKQEK